MRSAVCSAARGHHLCLPGTHPDSRTHSTWNTYSFRIYEWLMFWLCRHLCSCICSLCALSNTRLFFKTTRGQASWSEMGQGSEKDALWQESSWRTTLKEGRKHYGKRPPTGITEPVWNLHWVSITDLYNCVLHPVLCQGTEHVSLVHTTQHTVL